MESKIEGTARILPPLREDSHYQARVMSLLGTATGILTIIDAIGDVDATTLAMVREWQADMRTHDRLNAAEVSA